MNKIIFAAAVLSCASYAGAQTALTQLKGSASPEARVVVPAARAVVADAAVAPAHGELIVTGEVVSVKDDPSNPRFPVSEHAPMWKIATIKVARTLKGAPVQTVEVWFPASMDIAWAATPKFKVGQTGVWILTREAASSGHYAALRPDDFHAAPGQPQALYTATQQDLLSFKDQISAPLMQLDFIEGVGIGADAAGQPVLYIYYLVPQTNAAKARQAALNLLTPGQAAQLKDLEASGQLKLVPTSKLEG